LAEVTQTVREFISKYIDSIDLLETLLLLRDTAPKEWGATAVSRALQIERTSAANLLDRLELASLIGRRDLHNEKIYRYGPATPELAAAMEELAKNYAKYRVRIIGLIYSRDSTTVQAWRNPVPGKEK
jgi:hypothetical protein